MTVAIEEQKSSFECFESLHAQDLTLERLQHLHYALAHSRPSSRYAGWNAEEAAEALVYLEELLPPGLRLAPPASGSRKSRNRTMTEQAPAAAPAFEAFSRSLPLRPYVSNDLAHGLKVVGRGQADLFRYIQHNQPSLHSWLVFDCDYKNALAKLKRKGLPLPTYVAINPNNGHSHLFYGLRDPVCVSELAHWKPLLLLRRIEYQLREELGADAAYGGFISKNPLNDHWTVKEVNPVLWGLLDFKEHLTLPKRLPRKASTQGLGRNCTLFDVVRGEAYACVLSYRLGGGNLGTFKAHIEAIVISHNSAFPVPLSFPEVRAIAKSIASWTWKNYTGRLADEEFTRRQQKRGRLGGLAKGLANAEKRAEALKMAAEGVSQKAIAEALGVPVRTLRSWKSGK